MLKPHTTCPEGTLGQKELQSLPSDTVSSTGVDSTHCALDWVVRQRKILWEHSQALCVCFLVLDSHHYSLALSCDTGFLLLPAHKLLPLLMPFHPTAGTAHSYLSSS